MRFHLLLHMFQQTWVDKLVIVQSPLPHRPEREWTESDDIVVSPDLFVVPLEPAQDVVRTGVVFVPAPGVKL